MSRCVIRCRQRTELRITNYELRSGFMGRRKMKKAERRLLKRTGFGREFKDMGALVCALEEAKAAPRVAGYALKADSSWGDRTRRRVRRERWNRQVRVMRRRLVYVLVYGGSLAAFLLLVGGLWDLVHRLMG